VRPSMKRRPTRWPGAGKPVRRLVDQTRLQSFQCGARLKGTSSLELHYPSGAPAAH
jgi:hypothetical protein